MKNRIKVLETICTKIVYGIASAMFLALTFWAVKYSHRHSEDYSSEHISGVFDSLGANLPLFILILVVFYLLQVVLLRGTKEQQRKKVKIFLIIDMVITGILAFIWVTGCHIKPSDDQLQVYLTSVEFSQGIYRDMEAYFYMCPQQYGLAFLYECIWWIWESYHFVQYINIIFLLMIIYFGYRINDCLFKNERINLYTILVINMFLPLFFYINFVYGEVGCVAMSLCCIWAVLQWKQTEKIRYIVAALLTMSLAVLVRMNMIIVAIALFIVLLMYALTKKKWKACVLALLLLVVPLGSIELVELSYELRSGLEVGDGIPVSVNVAMGMQQSWQGAGAYNAYNHQTFWNEGGGDTKVASEVGKAYIAGRLQEFKNDPGMARFFYQSKIWEQWNEGSFGSLLMTSDFEAAPFGPAQEIYGGSLTKVTQNYMERYLFVIYLMALVCCAYGLLFEKELKKTILPMIVIGGMIFSLLWEAKARYVFPYITVLLPAVAVGLHFSQLLLENGVKRIKDKVSCGR